MASLALIQQSENILQVNLDTYELNKVMGVKVKVLSWKYHLLKMIILGVLTSSILFIFIPFENDEYGLAYSSYLPLVGFIVGIVFGLITSSKNEFQLKFDYSDETGIQWFTAAKSKWLCPIQGI